MFLSLNHFLKLNLYYNVNINYLIYNLFSKINIIYQFKMNLGTCSLKSDISPRAMA